MDKHLTKKMARACVVKFLFIVITLFLPFSIYYFSYNWLSKYEPTPLVIFAGGGSVQNYIEKKYSKNNDSVVFATPKSVGIPKSVYINIPSEYGWDLLKEEIERFKDDRNPHPFLYICLSAEKMKDNDTASSKVIDVLKKTGARIYGYHIGDDPLMVYDSTNQSDTIKTISVNNLIDLLGTAGKKVYATSQRSGTFARYKEILDSTIKKINTVKANTVKADLDKGYTLFYENDKCKDAEIVLGSKYYKPERLKNDNRWLYVVPKDGNGEDKAYKKPLYLYFVVHKTDNGMPHKQIVDFFKKLGIQIEDSINKRSANDNVPIVVFNDTNDSK